MNKKFRIWDKLAKTFIFPDKGYQGHYVLDLNGRFHNLHNGSGGDEYVVQQWTGLLDKNGREIYEGDIVLLQEGECDAATKHTCEIFIKQTNHSAAFFHARPFPRDDRGRQFSLYRNIYEIIGNIFETPLDNDPTKD